MKPESEILAVKNVVLGARGVKGKRTCVCTVTRMRRWVSEMGGATGCSISQDNCRNTDKTTLSVDEVICDWFTEE